MSHRDFARSFERALRRAKLPMGFSAGFSPHPKISWVNASPTGVASEAEYVEIGLAEVMDPEEVRRLLDEALPPDLDVLECVQGYGGSLPERITVSLWQLEFPGVAAAELQQAGEALMAAERASVSRMTKNGLKDIDVRGALLSVTVSIADPAQSCATMEVVVQLGIPVVRPDDVLAALRDVAGLAPSQPPKALRLAQGLLDDTGQLVDPLELDRAAALVANDGGAGPGMPKELVVAPPAT